MPERKSLGCGTLALIAFGSLFVLNAITKLLSPKKSEQAVVTSIQLAEKWFDKDGNPVFLFVSKTGSALNSYADFQRECQLLLSDNADAAFIGAAIFDASGDVFGPSNPISSGPYSAEYLASPVKRKLPYATFLGNPHNGFKEFTVMR